MAAASTGRNSSPSSARTLDETLFAPESRDAPIQIAGPAESAASPPMPSGSWARTKMPGRPGGATHPLLPLEVQREAEMPHATAQLDWDLGPSHHHPPARLRAGGPLQLCAAKRRRRGPPLAPHRAACRRAAAAAARVDRAAQPVAAHRLLSKTPAAFPSRPAKSKAAPAFSPPSRNAPSKPLPPRAWPRKAGSRPRPASPPRSAAQLLHAVLHAVWAGPPDGIRSHNELLRPERPRALCRRSRPARAAARRFRASLRERMPRRYLELEEQRLTRLVTEWLDYEATRIASKSLRPKPTAPSTRRPHLRPAPRPHRPAQRRFPAGHRLQIRRCLAEILGPAPPRRCATAALCRLRPRIKTKNSAAWSLPKCAAGDLAFAGHVGDARATLFAGLSNTSSLVKNNLTAEQLIDWRQAHRAAGQRFSRRPRRSRPARVSQNLRTLRPANALPHSGESSSARSRRRIRESEEDADE